MVCEERFGQAVAIGIAADTAQERNACAGTAGGNRLVGPFTPGIERIVQAKKGLAGAGRRIGADHNIHIGAACDDHIVLVSNRRRHGPDKFIR